MSRWIIYCAFAALIVVMLALGAMQAKACDEKGGVWLPRDGVCLPKGTVIELDAD